MGGSQAVRVGPPDGTRVLVRRHRDLLLPTRPREDLAGRQPSVSEEASPVTRHTGTLILDFSLQNGERRSSV